MDVHTGSLDAFSSFLDNISKSGKEWATFISKNLNILNYTEKYESSEKHWPSSFNGPHEALDKIAGEVIGIYWHNPSMNLVIMDSEKSIGIRSNSLYQIVTKIFIKSLKSKFKNSKE